MNEPRPELRPQQQTIYEAFLETGAPATDAEIAERLSIPGNSVRPRRRELADKGLLEKAGRRPSSNGRSVSLWRVVPPERVAEVQEATESRKPRRRPLESLSQEEKLEAVRRLLRDDEVNRALQEQTGRMWSRARGRARSAQSEQERELQAEIAKAERDRDLVVDFLKAKRNLVRTAEVIRGVTEFVREDLDRAEHGEPMRIAAGHWPEVADLLFDIAATATAAEELVRGRFGLNEDVIELDSIEIEEVFELAEGDGGDAQAADQRSEEPDG